MNSDQESPGGFNMPPFQVSFGHTADFLAKSKLKQP
jgi:hypothetical protein